MPRIPHRLGHPGPALVAVLGLLAIAFGAAIKTGVITIRRGAGAADTSHVTVRTAGGDVALPATTDDTEVAAPPSSTRRSESVNRALTGDSLVADASLEDSNAVRPTPQELAELASAMIVPVAGVRPADLLDTFDAPRSGNRRHNALDIPAPRNTPVLAATRGRILSLFTSDAGGLMIYASDPTDRFVLMYAHLALYATGIKEGMPLSRGDTIGYVGTSGNAPPSVPHLHFALARTTDVTRWWSGMPVDPRPLLQH